jgi:hypothetical protein
MFHKFLITQTPDLAISRTAGSSVNSKEKEINPKYRITANAIPVMPPICITKYINLGVMEKRIISAAFCELPPPSHTPRERERDTKCVM